MSNCCVFVIIGLKTTFRDHLIWIQGVLGSNAASVGEGMFHLGISPQSYNL